MNKKTLSESDICDKFIRPAIESAGWDGMSQIYREYPLRAGRVVVRGRKAARDISTVLRADYACERANSKAERPSVPGAQRRSGSPSPLSPSVAEVAVVRQSERAVPLRLRVPDLDAPRRVR
jgi:hypothetical protein